jgi:alpha-L-rhamnosidase
MDAQRPSGAFPGYCPFPFCGDKDHGIAWSDAGVICPWTIWKIYGDTRVIKDCWQPMVKFMDWRKRKSRNFLGINQGQDWGDWLSLGGKTPLDFLDTVYFAYTSQMMSEMAAAIGKKEEATNYQEQFANIKQAFDAKYVKPDGSLAVDTETAYVLALYVNLLPEELRQPAGEILAGKIRAAATNDNSGITTGFLGTRPLLPVLSSVGQNDLAVQLFQSHKYPSWGYEVAQGATTVWERWNGFVKGEGFHDPGMNSFAHYSLGAVCEWMFFDLAGIDTDGVAYDHIIIRPTPPTASSDSDIKPIDWVKAHYDSIHGRISTEWRLTAKQFELKVTIPANTTATVYVPAKNLPTVMESGKALQVAEGVKSFQMKNDRAVIEIGSGSYDFTSRQ